MSKRTSRTIVRTMVRTIVREILALVLALIFIAPLILVVINSFKTYNEIYASPFALPAAFSFENYRYVWSDMNYLLRLMNSAIVTLTPIPFILLFGSMAAYKLCRTKTKLSGFIFYMLIATMLIPFNVFMVPFLVMAKNMRMTDNLWALAVIYVGFLTPFTVFLYHGFIKNIKQDIEESALIDGCGSFGIYARIVFPVMKPITATVTVLLSLTFWNDFFLPLLLIVNDRNRTLPLMAYKYAGQFMKDWSKILPGMVLLSIPIFFFFGFLQKYIIEGISQGAVKG